MNPTIHPPADTFGQNPAADLELMRCAISGKITSREPMKLATLELFAASTGFVFCIGALIHRLLS